MKDIRHIWQRVCLTIASADDRLGDNFFFEWMAMSDLRIWRLNRIDRVHIQKSKGYLDKEGKMEGKEEVHTRGVLGMFGREAEKSQM